MAEISGLHRVQSSVEGLSSDRVVPYPRAMSDLRGGNSWLDATHFITRA